MTNDTRQTLTVVSRYIDNASSKLTKTSQQINAVRNITQQAGQQFTQFRDTVGNVMNKASEEVVKFNGNMLSLLFFGMELQRRAKAAFSALFEGFKKVIPEGHKFNQLTNRMSANWEFFKFQLARALTQTKLFTSFTKQVINLIKQLQQLPKPVKAFIAALLPITAAIGGILMMIGIWWLGLASVFNVAVKVKDMFVSMATTTAVTSAKVNGLTGQIEETHKKVKQFDWEKLGKIGVIVSATLALLVLAYSITNVIAKSEDAQKQWSKLGDAFLGLFNNVLPDGITKVNSLNAAMLIVSMSIGNVVALLGMLTAMFLHGSKVLGLLVGHITGSVYSAFKSMGDMMKNVAEAAEAMWNALRGKSFNAGKFNLMSRGLEGLRSRTQHLRDTFSETFNELNADVDKNMKKWKDAIKTPEEMNEAIKKLRNTQDKATGKKGNPLLDLANEEQFVSRPGRESPFGKQENNYNFQIDQINAGTNENLPEMEEDILLMLAEKGLKNFQG